MRCAYGIIEQDLPWGECGEGEGVSVRHGGYGNSFWIMAVITCTEVSSICQCANGRVWYKGRDR